MKTIHRFLLNLAYCFLVFFSPTIHTSYTSLQDKSILELTGKLNDIAFSALRYTMHTLENNITYWHEQKKNHNSQANEHIIALKDIEQNHAKALGTLHILQQTKNITPEEYSTKTLNILSSFTHIPSSLEHRSFYEDLEEKLSKAIQEMSNYKKPFDRAIYAHAKPSHLAHNWWKYLVGVTAISIFGYTAYEYRQNVSQFYFESIETLRQQWHQRIVMPIKKIFQNLSLESYEENQKNLEKNLEEIEDLQIAINQATGILAKRRTAFTKETREYYQRRPDVEPYDVDAYVERHIKGDDTDVTHDVTEEARNAVENFYHDIKQNGRDWIKSWIIKPAKEKNNFRLLEAGTQLFNFYKLKVDEKELELQKIKLEGLKAMFQGKQQWYLQEVNTMLGAMFPAALTLYAGYKISTYAFSKLFFKKIILIPLQERILTLRKMLNYCDDGIQKQLSDENTGRLAYWTHTLRQYLIQMPDEQQESFKQDIKDLESIELTIKQKHEVVKRMYDIYGFLKVND